MGHGIEGFGILSSLGKIEVEMFVHRKVAPEWIFFIGFLAKFV